MSSNTISNQTIDLNDKTQIFLVEDLHLNSTNNSRISLQCVQTPLSLAGNLAEGNMNLSNLVLITFIDENVNEIIVNISENKPIEFFILQDNNFIISPMILQNISPLISDPSMNNRQFNLHFINITQINSNISLSVHFEMFPLNLNLSYMLIYKFDDISQLNSSIQQTDDWTI